MDIPALRLTLGHGTVGQTRLVQGIVQGIGKLPIAFGLLSIAFGQLPIAFGQLPIALTNTLDQPSLTNGSMTGRVNLTAGIYIVIINLSCNVLVTTWGVSVLATQHFELLRQDPKTRPVDLVNMWALCRAWINFPFRRHLDAACCPSVFAAQPFKVGALCMHACMSGWLSLVWWCACQQEHHVARRACVRLCVLCVCHITWECACVVCLPTPPTAEH